MKDTNFRKIIEEAKDYVDSEMAITEGEAEDFDSGNAWLAKLKGNSNPAGSWSPRVVKRPTNILVSRRQLRGLGVNYGK